MGIFNRILGKSDEPPSQTAFAKLLTKALRQAGDERDIQFDADEFMLTFDDGEGIHPSQIWQTSTGSIAMRRRTDGTAS